MSSYRNNDSELITCSAITITLQLRYALRTNTTHAGSNNDRSSTSGEMDIISWVK